MAKSRRNNKKEALLRPVESVLRDNSMRPSKASRGDRIEAKSTVFTRVIYHLFATLQGRPNASLEAKGLFAFPAQ
jgi:hypothetical protein